ncbi:Deoxyribonuclease-2-alpha [Trichinella spiralis]|uniref:Deoxyribonuclease-2-alpha n=1 Tax=Trichinella spiralis TaxID=6334 RepID=A0ABR3KEU0_TRISP
MTIAKTQINAIAASLFHAEPFVYYNDIPETETAGMPDFKKLAEGQIPSTPPFTINRSIKLTGAGAVPVHIYSKSAKSRYGNVRASGTANFTISQDSKCKNANGAGDADWAILYKGPRQDRGIPNVKTKSNGKGVIMISTAVGANDGAWIVHTVPGFPKARTGYSWPAAEIAKGHLLICMTIAETQINAIAASLFRAQPFVYYNDIPETETAGMPDFKKLAEGHIPTTPPFTISRSIKLTGAGAVPVHIYSKSAKSRYGFPAARTGYSWPAAETAKGHLLICMTIAETQINAVAASLIQIEPFVYYNDIPETETAGMPDFKKLAEGQIPTTPPFTTRRSIKTAAQAPVDIHIYSKSAKSKYEIYKKVINLEIYFASWISHIQKIK